MAESSELTVLAEQLLAPVPGGTGRYTAELLRALAATAPEGWYVSSVVARHRDVTPARVAGVHGPRRLALPRRALAAAWQLGFGPWPGTRAVHAPTPLAPPRVPRGSTLSVTAHDAVPWSHPETLTPRGAAWHRRMITRAASRASALVVPTAAVASELAAHVPAAGAARVVGHGARRCPAEVAWESSPTPDVPEGCVLAVGTIEPRKGVEVLLDAVSRLEGRTLVLIGQPGWGGLDPPALARRYGLPPERLRVLGRLSDAGLAHVLRRAGVLAVPSLAEGFGLPVLEGMAAGTPVVHSDIPALVEVSGGAGRAVPVGDAHALATAIGEVLGSPALAAGMATAGLERAERYSWETAARQIWGLHA